MGNITNALFFFLFDYPNSLITESAHYQILVVRPLYRIKVNTFFIHFPKWAHFS